MRAGRAEDPAGRSRRGATNTLAGRHGLCRGPPPGRVWTRHRRDRRRTADSLPDRVVAAAACRTAARSVRPDLRVPPRRGSGRGSGGEPEGSWRGAEALRAWRPSRRRRPQPPNGRSSDMSSRRPVPREFRPNGRTTFSTDACTSGPGGSPRPWPRWPGRCSPAAARPWRSGAPPRPQPLHRLGAGTEQPKRRPTPVAPHPVASLACPRPTPVPAPRGRPGGATADRTSGGVQ